MHWPHSLAWRAHALARRRCCAGTMPISTRSKYASGEASPPPHCLANASTIEEHNDYQVKFRKELQERKAQRLREAQEALGASDVEKHFEGVRRSQVDAGQPTWAEPAAMAAATGGYAQQQEQDAEVQRLRRSDAALAQVQGAGAGAGAGAAVVLCVAQVFGRGCHDGSITACMGAGAGADADAGASASAPPKKPTWKPRTVESLRRAREHAAAKKLQQQRGLLRGRARAPRHAPPQEPTKAAKVTGKRSAANTEDVRVRVCSCVCSCAARARLSATGRRVCARTHRRRRGACSANGKNGAGSRCRAVVRRANSWDRALGTDIRRTRR